MRFVKNYLKKQPKKKPRCQSLKMNPHKSCVFAFVHILSCSVRTSRQRCFNHNAREKLLVNNKAGRQKNPRVGGGEVRLVQLAAGV